MTTIIKLRRDTAANWTIANPILAAGEPGLETDTLRIKYGDGSTTWANLSYQAVANATFATTAGEALEVALANVTGIGNIASINLDGNTDTVLYGNGVFASVAGGSPSGSNGEIQFNISGQFASTGNLTFINGISGGTLEIGPPGAMQLDGNGTIVASNLSSAGNIYLSAGNGVVDLRATGNVTLKSDNANYEWNFDNIGDLTVPGYVKFEGGTYIGDEPGGGPNFRIVAPLGYGTTIETDSDISGNNWTWTFGIDSTFGAPGNIAVGSNAVVLTTTGDVSATGNISAVNIGNISSTNLDGNVSNVLTGNGTFVTLPVINANTVVWSTAPISNVAAGNAGEAAYDSGGNLYICVSTNTWSKFSGTTSW